MTRPMTRKPRTLLGVAVGDDAWQIAEVKRAADDCQTLRTTRLALPPDASDNAAAWGQALAEHLKANGYKSRHVVFGLDNRALFARRRSMPPTPNDAARRGLLRLAIEKEHGDGRLVFDYLDTHQNGSPQPDALLVATNQAQLNHLQAVADAAKLRVAGVVSSALSLTAGRSPSVQVVVDAGGADVVVQHGGKACGLTRVSFAGKGGMETLANQLARTAELSQDGATVAVAPADTAQVGLADNVANALSDRFNVERVDSANAAERVAAQLLSDAQPGLNFTDSRLVQAPVQRGGRYRRAGIWAVVLAVLFAGLLTAWGVMRASDIRQLQLAYDGIQEQATTLETLRDQTKTVAPWFDRRPATLDALASLTECFPREGRIWVTNLRLDAAGEGSLKCRADGKDSMLACLNAMQSASAFQNVQLRDWNEADRATGVVGFEIVFTYTSAEGGV